MTEERTSLLPNGTGNGNRRTTRDVENQTSSTTPPAPSQHVLQYHGGVSRYPNLMIADEMLTTGPRWRNTEELTRAQMAMQRRSVFTVDMAKTFSKYERVSPSAQILVLMFFSFALAVISVIEKVLVYEDVHHRIIVAISNPVAAIVVLCYILATPQKNARHRKESSLKLPGRPSSEATPSDCIFNVENIMLFLPVAISWTIEDWLLYMANFQFPPWAVNSITLLKLPLAALLNVFLVKRSHSRTQTLFLFAMVCLVIGSLNRASLSATWTTGRIYGVVLTCIVCLITSLLSFQHAQVTHDKNCERTSYQFFHVLLALCGPSFVLGVGELTIKGTIEAYASTVYARSSIAFPLHSITVLFGVAHILKVFFLWNLSQQFDIAYKAATFSFSWVLIYAFSTMLGFGEPRFDGANVLCMAASFVGYAASKSDETKLSVLKFIEKQRRHGHTGNAQVN